jgi:hypothetical protein
MTAENVAAAKAIRAELRELVKTDPRLKDLKISVRAVSASLMSEVKVSAEGYTGEFCDGGWHWIAGVLWDAVNKHWQYNNRHTFAAVRINGCTA